jgi:peptidoglycan/LPS O-acetylase OafA/YrhL
MSQPDEHAEGTPGWIWLCSLIPSWFSDKYRFWQTVGSTTFVLAVTRLPILQRPFTTRIVQYFGKISYALYLVHGPVTHSIGYVIKPWAWGVTGSDSKSQYIAGFLLGALFNIPIVIWTADLFWCFVDAPSVKFARWFENACIGEEPQSCGNGLPR